MSGHRPWAEMRQPRLPEDEAEIAEGAREILRENALNTRRREGISQAANLSHIEHEDEPT